MFRRQQQGVGADARASAGRISIEPTEQGIRCRIVGPKRTIVWAWAGDRFSRAVEGGSRTNVWAHGLADVRFVREERGSVVDWRLRGQIIWRKFRRLRGRLVRRRRRFRRVVKAPVV